MLDQEIQAICKEKIEKLLEADLTEQMQRLASSKENSSPAPFKESMTVAEAMEMVVAGHAFTDVWCAFLKRVCARDPMAIVQVYLVAQISTELVTELSATDPDLATSFDGLARLKRSRPTLQSVEPPDYGPKVQRDWLAKLVKCLVRYVELVGDQYRSHAKRPDLYAAPLDTAGSDVQLSSRLSQGQTSTNGVGAFGVPFKTSDFLKASTEMGQAKFARK